MLFVERKQLWPPSFYFATFARKLPIKIMAFSTKCKKRLSLSTALENIYLHGRCEQELFDQPIGI